jgi:small-conductance mechanosensitive channel
MTIHTLHRFYHRFRLAVILSASLLAVLALAGPIPAEDTAEISTAEEARISTYFDATLAEIQEFIDSRDETSFQVQEVMGALDDKNEAFKQQLRQLEGMARIVQGRPYETRGVLQDLRSLSAEIQEGMHPAEQLLQKLKNRQDKIALLATEASQPWTRELPPSLRDTLEGLKRTLSQNAQAITTHQKELTRVLKKSTDLHDRAQETMASMEKDLPGSWKRLLFSPDHTLLDPEVWKTSLSDLGKWVTDLPAFLRIQLPATGAEWIDWTGKVTLYWLLLLGTIFFGLRKTSIWRQMTEAKKTGQIRSPGIWVSLSLALLGAFFTSAYHQSTLQLSLIYLALFYGIMRTAWIGRVVEEPENRVSALRPGFFLFAGATLLQLLDLPQLFSTLIWLSMLGISILTARKLHTPLLLEKTIVTLTPFICAILFLLAFFGLLQLSLIMGQVWALLCLFLQMVVVATGWLRAGVEHLPATLGMTIVKGLVIGFGSPLIWILGFSVVLSWLTIHLGSDFVFQRISSMNLSWGDYSLNFFRFTVIIVLFYLTHAFVNIWGAILDQKYFRWSKIDPGIITSLRTTGGYAIWIVSGIIAVNIMGIRLTSLAVIAGGLSVGIGFGLQNLINNFISGLILLFGRTIQADDIIQLDQTWGTVRKVNIRNTEVQTFDNSIIFVPNSELISGRLTNWTHRGDNRLRRDLLVGVAYGSDIEHVKTTLMDVAKFHPHVLSDPAPTVLFTAFGASSLDFILRVWVDHIDFSLSTLSDLHEGVNTAFAKAGIEISFPQMDLHVRDSVPFKVASPEEGASS